MDLQLPKASQESPLPLATKAALPGQEVAPSAPKPARPHPHGGSLCSSARSPAARCHSSERGCPVRSPASCWAMPLISRDDSWRERPHHFLLLWPPGHRQGSGTSGEGRAVPGAADSPLTFPRPGESSAKPAETFLSVCQAHCCRPRGAQPALSR